MKRANRMGRILLGVVIPLVSGCATSALWDNKSFNEPDQDPELRLYYSTEARDVLVQYTELRERSSTRSVRSYFLYRNLDRVGANRKPRFVDHAKQESLTHVPVLSGAAEGPIPSGGGLYASQTKNRRRFGLYSEGQPLGDYELPMYPNSTRRLTQIALTPFALVLDATIVGGVVAYWIAEGMAASAASGTF